MLIFCVREGYFFSRLKDSFLKHGIFVQMT